MKIAYAQMKISAGHPDLNAKKILKFIDEAKNQKSDVIIFPECAISGKMLGETLNQQSFLRDCELFTEEIISAAKNIVVVLDGAKKFDNFDVKFLSEPFSLEKNVIDEKITRPTIKIGCVGIQNTGKTIYVFDGGSAVYNSRGKVVQRAEMFAECLNFVELEEIDKMPALKLPDVSETEKIYRAISYGVKNFLEQIGIKKIVIGVSGGIDSAVAAALYTKICGAENVYLVNMPSKFNSATTKNLSEQLAKNLGCKYFVVPIQESVDWTVKQLESVGLEVSDFVKENIQARDRSARILAAIAASVGGGFTCNANKAESTVGYATLYGDATGFLSALADLWKFQVYDLARYMNEKIFCREVIPQGIIDIVPSAELSTAQNVDEGKGDPLKYPYHDYLFRAFAERHLTPEDILNWYAEKVLEENIGCAAGLVEKYFPTAADFIADLERWWKQFTGISVAKRIQSPPILAVTENPYGARAESQNCIHFTKKYLELKNRLLG
ncbi:MAG: NAD(+) synthase [Quinella sp. 3Q1]|nr:NAD(+) synthase [Quinella sp. 3Q1]MBR6888877.1 NAD(+) synthase [Selenomonadaceae bacterium]